MKTEDGDVGFLQVPALGVCKQQRTHAVVRSTGRVAGGNEHNALREGRSERVDTRAKDKNSIVDEDVTGGEDGREMAWRKMCSAMWWLSRACRKEARASRVAAKEARELARGAWAFGKSVGAPTTGGRSAGSLFIFAKLLP